MRIENNANFLAMNNVTAKNAKKVAQNAQKKLSMNEILTAEQKQKIDAKLEQLEFAKNQKQIDRIMQQLSQELDKSDSKTENTIENGNTTTTTKKEVDTQSRFWGSKSKNKKKQINISVDKFNPREILKQLKEQGVNYDKQDAKTILKKGNEKNIQGLLNKLLKDDGVSKIKFTAPGQHTEFAGHKDIKGAKFENREQVLKQVEDALPEGTKIPANLKNAVVNAKTSEEFSKALSHMLKEVSKDPNVQINLGQTGTDKVKVGEDKVQVGTKKVKVGEDKVQVGTEKTGEAHKKDDIKNKAYNKDLNAELDKELAELSKWGLEKLDPALFEKVKNAVNKDAALAELEQKLEAQNNIDTPDLKTKFDLNWQKKANDITKGNGQKSVIIGDPHIGDSEGTGDIRNFDNSEYASIPGGLKAHYNGNMNLVDTNGLKFVGHGKTSAHDKNLTFNDKGLIQLANGSKLELTEDGKVILNGSEVKEGQKLNLGKDNFGNDIILETTNGIDQHARDMKGNSIGAKDLGTNFKLTAGEVEIKSRRDEFKGAQMWSFQSTKLYDDGVADSGLMMNMLDGKKNTQAEVDQMIANNYVSDSAKFFSSPMKDQYSYRIGASFDKETYKPVYENRPIYEEKPVYDNKPIYEERPVYQIGVDNYKQVQDPGKLTGILTTPYLVRGSSLDSNIHSIVDTTVHRENNHGGGGRGDGGDTPLAFDLNGNGYQTTPAKVNFDGHQVNNIADGVLSIRGGNSFKDLFGNQTDLNADGNADGFANGFQALKALAAQEGLINGNDMKLDLADIQKLQAKHDLGMKMGYTGSVQSLASLGITEINLANTNFTTTTNNFDGLGNGLIKQDGATFKVNGQEREYADIWSSF